MNWMSRLVVPSLIATSLLTVPDLAAAQQGEISRADMRGVGLAFVQDAYVTRTEEDLDRWLARDLRNRDGMIRAISDRSQDFYVHAVRFADADSDTDAVARDVAVQLDIWWGSEQEAVEAVQDEILGPLMKAFQPGDLIVIVILGGLEDLPFFPGGHLMRSRDGVWEVIRYIDF
jgi:hypothetical protein